MRKELELAIAYLVALGYKVVKTGGSHFRIEHPTDSSKFVFMGGTPSDPRSFKNFTAMIKRHFELDLNGLLSDSKKMKKALKEARKQ
jgi:hypothetical protein